MARRGQVWSSCRQLTNSLIYANYTSHNLSIYYMAYQRRDSGYGASKGGKTFGGKKPWERGSDGRADAKTFMHDAVCAKCAQKCQVPFKPNGRKPVLCSNCFVKGEDRGTEQRFSRPERPSFDRPSSDRPSYSERSTGGDNSAQFKAINDKLDKIMEILEEALTDEVE